MHKTILILAFIFSIGVTCMAQNKERPKFHGGTKLPMNNETAVIIQYARQEVPSPSFDMQIGKISLPHFIRKFSLGMKLICC